LELAQLEMYFMMVMTDFLWGSGENTSLYGTRYPQTTLGEDLRPGFLHPSWR
jgi:hypothetical protein